MKRAVALLALCGLVACTVRGVVGIVAEEGDVVTDLPRVPAFEVTRTTVRGSSVEISMAPVEGAKDYRVYVLPRDEDVIVEDDGYVAVRGATYRCAGDREAPLIPTDGQMQVQSGAIASRIVGEVRGRARRAEDATLGYVYTRAGEGRVPVYALAEPELDADNSCYFHRYTDSRVVRYTKSGAERDALLAAGYRDDGITFYVPEAPSFDTRVIFRVRPSGEEELVVPDGSERASFAEDAPTPIFDVLTGEREGTAPLMRMHYDNACGREHDVLTVSRARFTQRAQQGRYAMPNVHYAGLTEDTTLVVEALDAGCPFRGHLSPIHRDATDDVDLEPGRQAWRTLEELRAMDANGEVFVNGQHGADSRPRALARAFVRVRPTRAPEHDFHASFDVDIPTPTPFRYASAMNGPAVDLLYELPGLDARLYSISRDAHAVGTFLGELWVSHGDAGAQTQSKLRITPTQRARVEAGAFLHAQMDVDIVTTDRRYPQIIVSDVGIPVQENMASGFALIVQVQGSWPSAMQVALCEGVLWEASNNCPLRDLSFRPDGTWAPTIPVGERAGVDRVSRIELYASTSRVYALLDGEPHGCVNLPAGSVPSGDVTVTYGDVLFHSGVDVQGEVLGERVYDFHAEHLQIETRRHLDDLAFSSGVPGPDWDETRVPCFDAF